jgi:hypothetical protein
MATTGLDNRARDFWHARLRRRWGPEGTGSAWLGGVLNEWGYRVQRHVFGRLGLDLPQASVLDVLCGTGVHFGEWQTLGAASMAGLDFWDWALVCPINLLLVSTPREIPATGLMACRGRT